MKTKYVIIFFTSVLLLVASEYIFLNELSRSQRIAILILTTIIAFASIVSVIGTVRRSDQDPK